LSSKEHRCSQRSTGVLNVTQVFSKDLYYDTIVLKGTPLFGVLKVTVSRKVPIGSQRFLEIPGDSQRFPEGSWRFPEVPGRFLEVPRGFL
jgi:hypothetical protein